MPGEFSVLMPPAVTREERTTTVANRPVDVHLVKAIPRGAAESYLVSVAEIPADVLRSTNPEAVLQGVQQATVRGLGASLISSKEIVADDMPGLEFAARKRGEGDVLARVLVGKDAVYTLVGTFRSGPPPALIVRFLDSFSTIGNPPSATLTPAEGRAAGKLQAPPGDGSSAR